MSKALNAIKDSYLWVVDWIDDNPQKAIWGFVALLIAALVF